jgi:ABC-2 type transport system ATP-binding protein
MARALLVEGLRKYYGTTRAVDGVDLTVDEGEIFGILGPNGSGKTTTVECSYGLRRADAGRIRLLGRDPHTDSENLRSLVGVQLQDSALPDRIRVWEAIQLFAALARQRVDIKQVLRQWDLAEKRAASYASLSGGQKQRLHVALALVTHPELVFLDEMTTGLDPNARREVWQLIEQVRREGTTVVLVSHFMDEAQRLCDRVAIMAKGRVVAQGTPAQLVRTHGGWTSVSFSVAPGSALPDLGGVKGVEHVRVLDGRVEVEGSGPLLVNLGQALAAQDLSDVELIVNQPNLEDAYLTVVGEQQ